jgi:hypothetical protein
MPRPLPCRSLLVLAVVLWLVPSSGRAAEQEEGYLLTGGLGLARALHLSKGPPLGSVGGLVAAHFPMGPHWVPGVELGLYRFGSVGPVDTPSDAYTLYTLQVSAPQRFRFHAEPGSAYFVVAPGLYHPFRVFDGPRETGRAFGPGLSLGLGGPFYPLGEGLALGAEGRMLAAVAIDPESPALVFGGTLMLTVSWDSTPRAR